MFTKICPFCNKIFTVKRNRIFCSIICANKDKWKKGIIKPLPKTGKYKKCIFCHKIFYVKKYRQNTQKCCSISCAQKYRATWYFGKNHPWYSRKHLEKSKNKMRKERPTIKKEKHPQWKGGTNPYVLIYKPFHPFAYHNYVREHRLVIEKYIGRYLYPPEVIHHIDNNPLNNKINNLILFPNHSAHMVFHNKQRITDNK